MTTQPADDLRANTARILNEDAAPLHLRHGEDFLTCKLPANTRVIIPNAPMQPVANRGASIRAAIAAPIEAAPLAELLTPGSRVTITLDDLSATAPLMRAPDVRQSILEVLLDLVEARGVEDYAVIIDRGLNRRLTPAELLHLVGERAQRRLGRRLTQLDIEDRDQATSIGNTAKDEPVLVARRIAESDLLIAVRISPVPAHGQQAPIGAGFCGVSAVALTHNELGGEDHAMRARYGKVLRDHVDTFHIEATLNNRLHDDQLAFLSRAEDSWSPADQIKLRAIQAAAHRLPAVARRALRARTRAAYEVIGVFAGQAEAVHKQARALALQQHTVSVEGQADIVIHDISADGHFNHDAPLNPILLRAHALGYMASLHRGTPLLKRGGTLILVHPCPDAFAPDQHPSALELFNRALPQTRDPQVLAQRWLPELANNPNYVEMYRRGLAYHSTHPIALWRWAEQAQQHAAQVIVVAAQNNHVPQRLGWLSARTMEDAITLARERQGRSARVSLVRSGPGTVIDVR
jgi:lactate racemase